MARQSSAERKIVQKHKKYSPSNDHAESECIDRYPASDVDNGVHRWGELRT